MVNEDDGVQDMLDDVELEGNLEKMLAYVRAVKANAERYERETGLPVHRLIDSATRQKLDDTMHDLAILIDMTKRNAPPADPKK